jgi:hypothetical protein
MPASSPLKLFQIRLSDILLIALIPAACAAVVGSLHWMSLTPQHAYVVAALSVLPGAVIGLVLVNWQRRQRLDRSVRLGLGLVLSAAVGLSVVPPLERRYTMAHMAANQTAAACACKTFAEAEELFRSKDYNKNGIADYAATLRQLSTVAPGQSPLIEKTFANAEGLPGTVEPYHGYVFKVILGQGPAATGGSRSYVVNGLMTKGYAMMACPAVYDETGRDCFLISNNGTIFQLDLGPSSPQSFAQTALFNPDTTWCG